MFDPFDGLSQSAQTYGQYLGNAVLQDADLVGDDESYFDVTEKKIFVQMK